MYTGKTVQVPQLVTALLCTTVSMNVYSACLDTVLHAFVMPAKKVK